MRKTVWIIMIGVCIALSASAADREVERHCEAKLDGSVTISNVSGSVTIESWDKPEIHCLATLERDVKELEFVNRNGNTTINVKTQRRFFGSSKNSAHLVIQVPKASSLRIKTVSADITVEDTILL